MAENGSNRFMSSSAIAFAGTVSGNLRARVLLALAAIDEVHQLRRPVRVPVTESRARLERGSYDPHTGSITISRSAPDPIGTFIHEFGHFLDHRVLHADARQYASHNDPAFDALMERCTDSVAIQTIKYILRKKNRFLTKPDQHFLKEALLPHEIFARAYMQWICTRASNAVVQSSLSQRLRERPVFAGITCGFQWELNESVDIMPLVVELFRTKGLS